MEIITWDAMRIRIPDCGHASVWVCSIGVFEKSFVGRVVY